MVQVPCGFYTPAASEELVEDIGAGWELVIRKDNPWPAREPLSFTMQHCSYEATKCLPYPNAETYIEVWKAYVVIHERYTIFYALANEVGYENVELYWEAWGGSNFNTKGLLKALDLEHLI